MSFGSRARIRLGALQHNLKRIRSLVPSAKVMSVIKANAYGHGLISVARNLAGVDALAVARLAEAIELRTNGIKTPIVLLAGVYSHEELRSAIQHELQLVVHCPEQLSLLKNLDSGSLCIWLKVDTGMNRLGFSVDEATPILRQLRNLSVVSEVRLMSHFASADELDNDATITQFERFLPLVDDDVKDLSLCNSAAALAWPELHAALGDRSITHWIRPGIAMFGISPFADKTGIDLGLQPVMQFEARLIAVKPITAGGRVGYKQSYVAQKDSVLGVVSAGYGDGYSRHFKTGTPVLLNGRKVAVVGNVSMDMIAVDLGVGARDQVGDIATLWGDGLPVEEVAPFANAIAYDLVCGVMNREASEIVD